MYPHLQPIPFRSAPINPGDTRILPFFGFPFLAGIAGGLLGGAAISLWRPWFGGFGGPGFGGGFGGPGFGGGFGAPGFGGGFGAPGFGGGFGGGGFGGPGFI